MLRWIWELVAGEGDAAQKKLDYIHLAWLEHALSRALARPFPAQGQVGGSPECSLQTETCALEDFASVLSQYQLPPGWCEADPAVEGGCVCQEIRFLIQCFLSQKEDVEWQVRLPGNSLRALVWRARYPVLRTAVLGHAHEAEPYWEATKALEDDCRLGGAAMREEVFLPMARVWWERVQTLCGVNLPMSLSGEQKREILDEVLHRLEIRRREAPDKMDRAKDAILGALKDPEQRKALRPAFSLVREGMQYEKTHYAPLLCFEANLETIFKDVIRAWPLETDGPARRECFLAAFLCYQANPTIQYLQQHSHIIYQLQVVLHWPRTVRGRAPNGSRRTLTLTLEEDPDGDRGPLDRVCELTALADWVIKRTQVLNTMDTSRWKGPLQVMSDMACLYYEQDIRATVRMRRMISQWRWLFTNAVPALYANWFDPDVTCILYDYLFQDDRVVPYTMYDFKVSSLAHRLLAFTAIYTIMNPALDTAADEHLDTVPPERWQAIAQGEYLPKPEEEETMDEDKLAYYDALRCRRIMEMVKRCGQAEELASVSLSRLQKVYPIAR